MAAIVISAPGAGHGPCTEACGHRDCTWQRETAARQCSLCGKPIEFDRPFYEHEGDVAHVACLENQNQDEPPTRRQ